MKNSRNEYCEEIERDSRFRREYYHGVMAFLNKWQQQEEQKRQAYFSPKNYKNNPEFYREKFLEMLGAPLQDNDGRVRLKEKEFIAKDKNVNIFRMTLLIKGTIPFYGLYFEQTEDKESAPFILALHGVLGTPELISGIYQDSSNYNHVVRRITERGANVFVPQLLLWDVDTYGNPHIPRQEIDGKIRQLGGSMTALELHCLQSALTYFIETEKVNANRVGVVGLSYGGMYALHFAAIDLRIKACYSCSWLCNGFEYAWAEWSYKNAQKIASSAETAALICPRALVVAMGKKDSLFDYQKTEKSCLQIKEFYKEFTCEKKFKYILFDGEHEIDKSNEELNFLFENI